MSRGETVGSGEVVGVAGEVEVEDEAMGVVEADMEDVEEEGVVGDLDTEN